MIVPKSAKIEKAASKDKARPVLTQLYVREGANGSATLEATDSYILVRVPVTMEDGDKGGFVPPSVLVDARKVAGRSEDVRVIANSEVGYDSADGVSVRMPRPDIGTFPNTDMLFPDEWSTFEVGVSPKLLLAAAEAMGSPDGVRLRFARVRSSSDPGACDPLRPVHVQPLRGGCEGAEGIVMPIRIG